MIKVIDGDLFDTKAEIIAHQVNCQGVMGSGVALQIKKKYPYVYEEYQKIADIYMLGKIQILPTYPTVLLSNPPKLGSIDGKFICNLFGQDTYGCDGKQYTDLSALKNGFELLRNKVTNPKSEYYKFTIAMPYKIGCVRGGADWNLVYKMIKDIFEDCDVELWRLDRG